MYTVIPMPATEWNGRNLRYCMAFLPAAGFVISAAEWVLFFVCYSLHLSDVFFASFFCALPVLVTGKIHIDGLIDTCDALGSHSAREKKLQILDDPHAGAFGIAGAVVYFLLFFGVGCNFPTPSYIPSYTTYLFDNQIKIIAGVGCRKKK